MYRGKVGMLFDALFDMEDRSIAFSKYSYKYNDKKPTNYTLMRMVKTVLMSTFYYRQRPKNIEQYHLLLTMFFFFIVFIN